MEYYIPFSGKRKAQKEKRRDFSRRFVRRLVVLCVDFKVSLGVIANRANLGSHCAHNEMTADEIMEEILQDRLYYGTEGGVTFSGGDPLYQVEAFTELARRINLRATPELTFVYDESLRHGARINTILNDIERKKVKSEEDE